MTESANEAERYRQHLLLNAPRPELIAEFKKLEALVAQEREARMMAELERDQQERFKHAANKRADDAEAKVNVFAAILAKRSESGL